jgi:hypothetical protein
MSKHTLPPQFRGLQGVVMDIWARLESLERRPRVGTERIDATADVTLDPVTRWVWANSSTTFTITLPDPWDGATVTIKNNGTADVVIVPPIGTIAGNPSYTVPGGIAQIATFQSDSVNWIFM